MRSLRARIAVAVALVAVAVAAVIGAVVTELTTRDRLDRARDSAASQVIQAAQVFQSVGSRFPPAVGPDDAHVPAALRRAVADGHVATYLDRSVAPTLVWAGTPVPGEPGGVFVARSYAPDEQALAALRRTLIAVGALSAIGGALLGAAIAARLSSRIRRAAATARRVAQGDLDARVNMRGRDEVAALGQALDQMAEAAQTRIERERRFVADVAHDLRTPITGLVTAAELLPAEPAVGAVRQGVGRLRNLVEDLLEIARLEAGVEKADSRDVDLGRLVAGIVGEAEDVQVTARPASRTLADPRRVERVLVNLIANARSHGAPPIEIDVAAGRVSVRDHGPGFPPDLIDHALDRFTMGDRSRSGGTGLGLAIAAGQARVLGGSLVLANAPGGGGVAVLALPTVVS